MNTKGLIKIKIHMTSGTALIPARFWDRKIAENEEEIVLLQKEGYHIEKVEIGRWMLDAVATEVATSFEVDEINAFENFEAFFSEVDVQNAYEEEWENEKQNAMPYYKLVYDYFTGVKNA